MAEIVMGEREPREVDPSFLLLERGERRRGFAAQKVSERQLALHPHAVRQDAQCLPERLARLLQIAGRGEIAAEEIPAVALERIALHRFSSCCDGFQQLSEYREQLT